MSVVKFPTVVEYLSKSGYFMQAKPRDRQQNLYEVQLEFLCDSRQPLLRLSQVIDWSHFDETFGNLYSEGQGRYCHARQGKRANKQVRKLKTYLGCVVRDIERKIEGSSNLQKHFSPFLETAHRLLSQQRKTRISCKACMCWKWSVLPKARRIRNTSLVAR